MWNETKSSDVMTWWFMAMDLLFHLIKYFCCLNHPLNMKQNFDCVFVFIMYITIEHYIPPQNRMPWIVKLHFEVDPVMVLQVWVISIPVPPSPKRCCHFIKKFALCFVTEYMLSQALSSVRFLLPHFLLVSSLLPGRHKLFSWTDNAVISRW